MRRPAREVPRQPVLQRGAPGGAAPAPPSLLDLPHLTFTRSGRSAILLSLRLLGLKTGDRVLVPTYHCPTMVAPVVKLGGVPVFYPLDARGEPDLQYLGALSSEGCVALLAAHLFGLPRDFSGVAAFCRKRNLSFIEDCAHCFYGSPGEHGVGTLGDFAIGSLPKFFPVREGGLLASARREFSASLPARGPRAELQSMWDAIDMASRAGRLGPAGNSARALSRLRGRAVPASPDAPARFDDAGQPAPARIEAAGLSDPLLEVQAATRIDTMLVRRTRHASAAQARSRAYTMFRDQLGNHPRLAAPVPASRPGDAPYVVPLVVSEPDSAYASLRRLGVPVFRWDQLWPGTPVLDADAGAGWSRGLIQLACHQSLRQSEVEWICAAVRQVLDS